MRFCVCVCVQYVIYILHRLYHNKHSEVSCQKDTENSPLSKMDGSSRLKSSKDMAEHNTHRSTRYN